MCIRDRPSGFLSKRDTVTVEPDTGWLLVPLVTVPLIRPLVSAATENGSSALMIASSASAKRARFTGESPLVSIRRFIGLIVPPGPRADLSARTGSDAILPAVVLGGELAVPCTRNPL